MLCFCIVIKKHIQIKIYIRGLGMKVCSAVVKRLRELADSKNISLYKLQKDSGIPEGTFLSLIYGNRKGVNLTTLLQLIQTLDISAKEFFDSPLFDEENLDI